MADRIDQPTPGSAGDYDPASVVALLTARKLTVAVAESLTGGLLVAELISVPGASSVVLGGIVAYQTALKHTLLGVDAELLAGVGPVDPRVAIEMAIGVRTRLTVNGRAPAIGLATTGVAGPDPQGGKAPGTVFVGLAMSDRVQVRQLSLTGSRDEVRAAVVTQTLRWLAEVVTATESEGDEVHDR